MATKYRLSCSACQKEHAVLPRQAGETLACDCGHEMLLPTLRELRTLPAWAADTPPATPRDTWTPARGTLFVLGLLLLAIAVVGHFQIVPRRKALQTAQPQFQKMRFDVQLLSPLQAWEAWEHFREQTLDDRLTPYFLEQRDQYRELSMYLYFLWALGVVGIVLAAVAVIPRRQRR